MNDRWYIYALGFIAQFFFSARTIIQWYKSEKAHEVTSPSLYWICSVLGSYIFFVYGYLRDDFSIILGQFISYYIYLWNLDRKDVWNKLPFIVHIILLSTPVIAAMLMLSNIPAFVQNFFHNDEIPVWLILLGSGGQLIFTFRFIYQWFYSVRRKMSILPAGFWIISLLGSGTIITYAIIRKDPVLILGQSVGFVAYCRNLSIGWKRHHSEC